MTARSRPGVLGMALALFLLVAESDHAEAADADAAPPDAELLEFLADAADADGEEFLEYLADADLERIVKAAAARPTKGEQL